MLLGAFRPPKPTTRSAVVVIVGIALLASSIANGVCHFRFTGTHSWQISSGIKFSIPPLWVVGSDGVAIVGIAFLASSFANALCLFRFSVTHSREVSGGIWFSIPPLGVCRV